MHAALDIDTTFCSLARSWKRNDPGNSVGLSKLAAACHALLVGKSIPSLLKCTAMLIQKMHLVLLLLLLQDAV